MLVELTVENLAIIERAQIALGPGFTVLTGETGAGKSLLVDALELALGERADTDLVRAGAARASVSATIDLSGSLELRECCEALGLELEDGLLFIQREVFAEGRSQCRVGGRLAPVSALRQIGQLLVDLHGQHDHQSLLSPERHVNFLDAWIGRDAQAMLLRVENAYRIAEDSKRKLAALQAGIRDREHRLDLLRYQVDEISSAAPQVGEMSELEAQLSRLRNVDKLSSAFQTALEALSDHEASALSLLSRSVKTLEGAAELDPSLPESLSQIRDSLYTLEEGVRALRANSDSLESDPQQLEDVAARIDLLKKLRRKYGEDEAEVIAFLDRSRVELSVLEDADANVEGLVVEVDHATAALQALASELTSLRLAKSQDFAAQVQNELRELAMERALFEVRIEPKTVDASGGDRIEFFFSANAGETARPLAKIASGGEMSRVMLGIKAVLAGKVGVPTLVFDEVDAGLGGRAAAVVARKLEQLATYCQVLVISHLPQIAGRASAHFRIEKNLIGERVVTGVRPLSPEERIEEIARMLAGEVVSDSALANAREMLSGSSGDPLRPELAL